MTKRDKLITKNFIWAYQKINFYDRNFFVRNWGQKNSLEIGKSNWLKMQNMTKRDKLITKNFVWAYQKINFYDRNFFVRNWGQKNSLEIGK